VISNEYKFKQHYFKIFFLKALIVAVTN